MSTIHTSLFVHKDNNYALSKILSSSKKLVDVIDDSIKYLVKNNHIFYCLMNEDVEEINDDIMSFCEHYELESEKYLLEHFDTDMAIKHIIDMITSKVKTINDLNIICKKFGDSYYNKYGWSITIDDYTLQH